MRLYYCMEAEGRRHHVRTALGVDARAWNGLQRRLREWRRRLEQRYGISTDAELLSVEPASGADQPESSCGCSCHTQPAPMGGWEIVAQGLRLVEDFAVETGGVKAINVCLDKDDVPAYRNVSLDRLYNRVNATAVHDGVFALAIFGQEPDEMVDRTYLRLRNYNPVPVRIGACGDGWDTRNLPIDRIIGCPAFRRPDTDCLLQVAGMVAQALLWREESCAGADSGENAGVFAVLDRALNRRASRNDPLGVVRR